MLSKKDSLSDRPIEGIESRVAYAVSLAREDKAIGFFHVASFLSWIFWVSAMRPSSSSAACQCLESTVSRERYRCARCKSCGTRRRVAEQAFHVGCKVPKPNDSGVPNKKE